MSSESEQAAVQAASDVYVVTRQGALLSETDLIHSVILSYIFISSFGEHKACVQVLANGPCSWNSASCLRHPADAV